MRRAQHRLPVMPASRRRTPEGFSEHPVAVLSGAVLAAARTSHAGSRADLAERAGIGLHVVDGAQDGSCPAWALSYKEFAAVADAMSALDPWLPTIWETATACDLLLTCVMNGEQAMATDVLDDVGARDLAVALLRWAVTGQLPAPGHLPYARMPGMRPGRLLDDAQLSLLEQQAAALSLSSSPDAWVGVEILGLVGGGR